MSDTEQAAEDLIEGPASPRTDVSSAEDSESSGQMNPKTGESPDFVAVPPYAKDNQPNHTHYADE